MTEITVLEAEDYEVRFDPNHAKDERYRAFRSRGRPKEALFATYAEAVAHVRDEVLRIARNRSVDPPSGDDDPAYAAGYQARTDRLFRTAESLDLFLLQIT